MAIKVHIQVGRDDLPWLADLLRSVGDAEVTVSAGETPSEPRSGALEPRSSVLKEGTVALLQRKANPQVREFLMRFIAEEVNERQASDELGSEATTYVRLHAPGPRHLGAYVYVQIAGGYVTLRLPKSYEEGCQYAFARKVKDTNSYKVRVPLTCNEAVDEARQLAGKAYQLSLEPKKADPHGNRPHQA